MDLPDHVAAFLAVQGLDGSAGVVAVSGGPDSVALAHVLVALRQRKVLSGLVLVHVNHRLRGADSDADAQLVGSLPALWCPEDPTLLPCRIVSVDTAAEAARRGANLEATARALRYAALAEAAQAEGAAWVAAAHTADDQAETVLFRLLRGTGLAGLRGMVPRRPLAGAIDLVRPLLDRRRLEVLDYVRAHGLPYREDRSNCDLAFTRNRIRHELIPCLEGDYNPNLVAALTQLAEQAQAVQAEMRLLAEELRARAELPAAGAMRVFRIDVLAGAPPHRVREMFRLVWQREGWPQAAMGFDEWQRLVAIVQDAATAWDLPGGIHVRRAGRVVQLTGPPAAN